MKKRTIKMDQGYGKRAQVDHVSMKRVSVEAIASGAGIRGNGQWCTGLGALVFSNARAGRVEIEDLSVKRLRSGGVEITGDMFLR